MQERGKKVGGKMIRERTRLRWTKGKARRKQRKNVRENVRDNMTKNKIIIGKIRKRIRRKRWGSSSLRLIVRSDMGSGDTRKATEKT